MNIDEAKLRKNEARGNEVKWGGGGQNHKT